MIIKIEIDTREPLSTEDKSILRAIGYLDTDEAPAEKAAAPAKKAAAPAKKTAAKKAEPVPTDDLTPGDVPVVDDKPAEEPDEDARDAAVARASELLSAGQRDRVMAALKDANAPRVSEITADKIGGFLKALAGDAA